MSTHVEGVERILSRVPFYTSTWQKSMMMRKIRLSRNKKVSNGQTFYRKGEDTELRRALPPTTKRKRMGPNKMTNTLDSMMMTRDGIEIGMKNDDDLNTRGMPDTDTIANDEGGYSNVKTDPDDEGIENNTTPEPSVDCCTNKTINEIALIPG